MTDHDLEYRLRESYRGMVAPAASADLRSSVASIPDAVEQDRPSGLMNRLVPIALATAALGVVILLGIGVLMGTSDVGTHDATPSPSVGSPNATDASGIPPGPLGNWIAYSTGPAGDEAPLEGGGNGFGDGPGGRGSDIFIAHEGVEPRLVAGRGDGEIWNSCPAFSPDGSMLAYGGRSPAGRAIRVVGVTRHGEIVAPNIEIPVTGPGVAPCPRWSADGTRLAYLEGQAVVVRELDGSTAVPGDGDPQAGEFRRDPDQLVSPDGDLVATDGVAGAGPCAIGLTASDGSDGWTVAPNVACTNFALAAWSPDSLWIVHLQDISGLDFRILATSIHVPFETVVIADAVRINHSRHWPGYGDVSWQPGEEPESDEHAWPGPRGGPPGRYFWDMGEARWMHHGDLSLRMGMFADAPTGDGTAVTVAGFPATREEQRNASGVLSRTWIVDIEGRRAFVMAYHGIGAEDGRPMSEAQLAEVDAIVASIRYEPSPDGTGFRLTFELPDGGWDSG